MTALFCDTPGQSLAAAVLGGLVGGALAVLGGLDAASAAILAGVFGFAGDLLAHAVRRDQQFLDAVASVRELVGPG